MTETLLDHCCILQGTDSRPTLSRGNTLPIVAVPWGMHHWTLQTDEGRWLFHPSEPHVQGVRLTHQPSPWMGDYAALCVMPQIGPLRLSARDRASSYRADEAVFRPDHLRVRLNRYRCSLELVPTCRGAVIRFEFDEGTPRVIVEAPAGRFEANQSGTHVIDGLTNGNSGGVPDSFAMRFIADFDKPIAKFARVDRAFYVEFAPGTRRVELRLAGSFISHEQARSTINHELIGRSFEGVGALARTAWMEHLERFALEGETPDQRRTFYTSLYRSMLFPRTWFELDARGNEYHYSPYDGRVHPGPFYTDLGFWDAHRTLMPWLHWLFPREAGRMAEGWLNAYREGGWLPQWSSPGYRACMPGTHSDSVLADAIVKRVGGFDYEQALSAMLQNTREEGDPDGKFGRRGVRTLDELGYLPADEFAGAVTTTLDHAYNDWCVAQIAQAMGRESDVEKLLERSGRWKHLWDPSTQFLRGHLRSSHFSEPFDPFAWGGDYTECGAWQALFAVPHDVTGLMRLLGGADELVARIDALLSAPPTFSCGSNQYESHEMTEMALADFGQYAHCNQPVHHVLWLYALAGAPEKCQRAVHRVLNELYSSGPRGLCGDDDNGEMSAWFLFASLGLYPHCPGSTSYTLGLPWLPRVIIRKPDHHDLSINTDRRLLNSPGTRITRRIDGMPHLKPVIDHADLLQATRIDVIPA